MLKTLSKDTLIYGFGKVAQKFIGFLLIPFYTRALSPEEYGVLDSIGTFVFLITTFLNMGLDSASSFYFFTGKSKEEKGQILFTTFVLRLITIIPSMILSFFSEIISDKIFGTKDYYWVVFISCMIMPATVILSDQENIYRFFREPWKYNILTIIKTVSSALLGILFVVFLKYGVNGVQLASFATYLIVIIYSYVFFTRKKYNFKFSFYWAKQMLKFGFPLVWAGIATWVYMSSNRFFLLKYKDLTEIGYYSIGNIFSQPISLISMAFQMSFGVLFYQVYNEETNTDKTESKKLVSRTVEFFILITVPIAVFLSVFGKEILNLATTKDYVNGIFVIPFLAFSLIFAQCLQMTDVGISISKKTWHFTWIIGVTAIANVILNILVIPSYGYIGAAATTMIANLIYLIIVVVVSNKFFKVTYRYNRITAYMLFSFIISIIVPLIDFKLGFNLNIASKIIIMICSFILPFIFGLIKIADIKNLYENNIKAFIKRK